MQAQSRTYIHATKTTAYFIRFPQSSRKLLQQYKEGTLLPGTTSEQLWTARKIKVT